jgi:hypothetical protein
MLAGEEHLSQSLPDNTQPEAAQPGHCEVSNTKESTINESIEATQIIPEDELSSEVKEPGSSGDKNCIGLPKFEKPPKVHKEYPLIEKPWDYAIYECDPDGVAYRLLQPGQTEPEKDLKVPEWEKVKTVTLMMNGYDREGQRLHWFKHFWSNPTYAQRISKNWKQFLLGIEAAIQMLRVGEGAWFSIPPMGQNCPFIVSYPTKPDPVYVHITLVDAEEKKPKPVVQKPPVPVQEYDPEANMLKARSLKMQADQEYRHALSVETGKVNYEKVLNKYTGLMSWFKNHPDHPLAKEAKSEQTMVKNNLALMHLKLHEYSAAIKLLDQVLTFDPNNSKALWRKACCFEAQNLYEDSLDLFKRVGDKQAINRVLNKVNERNKRLWKSLS